MKIAEEREYVKIDINTGETYETGVDRVYEALETQKQIENIKNNIELKHYVATELGDYFHYFYTKAKELDIPVQYKVRLLYLATFAQYDGGYLKETIEDEEVSLSKDDLRKKLRLGKSEFYRTINSLIDVKVLVECNNYFKLNTNFIIRGSVGKKKDYTRVFIDSIIELYEKCDARKHKLLYSLFILIEKTNLQYNIVCDNPREEDIVDIEPLSIKEVCELIGYDITNQSRLWRELRKFTIKGKYVFCKTEKGKKEFYAINPRLFYKGTRIKDLKWLIGVFDN